MSAAAADTPFEGQSRARRRAKGTPGGPDLEEFLSALATELRDPLRTILHLAQMIRDNDGSLDGYTREYAAYILSSAQRVYDVINGEIHPHCARLATEHARSSDDPDASF